MFRIRMLFNQIESEIILTIEDLFLKEHFLNVPQDWF